jgi:hypothetical protein
MASDENERNSSGAKYFTQCVVELNADRNLSATTIGSILSPEKCVL